MLSGTTVEAVLSVPPAIPQVDWHVESANPLLGPMDGFTLAVVLVICFVLDQVRKHRARHGLA